MLLNLIITDSPGYIVNFGLESPLGDPYYSGFFCELKLQYLKQTVYKREIWSYDRGNYLELHEALSNAPWNILDTFDTVDDIAETFIQLYLDICKQNIFQQKMY